MRSQALLGVVEGPMGTARKSRMAMVRMAGKTGTAEAAQRGRKGTPKDVQRWLHDDHAWFVAFAPYEAPQISVSVFVEHGGGGSHIAAPIARAIMQAWFKRHPYKPTSDVKNWGPPAEPLPPWGPLAPPAVPATVPRGRP